MLGNLDGGWDLLRGKIDFEGVCFGRYISTTKEKFGSLEALCEPTFSLENSWYSAQEGEFEVPEIWIQRTVRLCRASMKLMDWVIDTEYDHDIWEYTFQMKKAMMPDIVTALNRTIALT